MRNINIYVSIPKNYFVLIEKAEKNLTKTKILILKLSPVENYTSEGIINLLVWLLKGFASEFEIEKSN